MNRSEKRAHGVGAVLALGLVLSGCVASGGSSGDGDGGAARDVGPAADGGNLVFDFGGGGDASPVDAAVPDSTPDACVAGGEETCNGRDDDCDGTTDEGFDVGGACATGVGVCAAEGVRVCFAGEARCDAQAGAPEGSEVCDGRDNDCDGDTDEGFDVGVACRYDEGVCTSRGEMVCTGDGQATECDADPIELTEERCDERDNDCDGMVDEGIEIGAICEAGVGQCRRGGFVECAEDGEVICTAREGEPRVEECDGFDNDCDGFADEDFGAEACAAGEGACRVEGQTVCAGDGELVCNAVALEPSPEVCNGVDDDCDGATDEDFGGALGEACMNALGECGRAGVIVCNAAGDDAECVADEAPGEPAEVEACNGLDDDCDGAVDEEIPGVGEVCEGIPLEACQAPLTACDADGEIVCQAVNLEPGREFCNRIDDDCDGEIDEDFVELGEPCEGGEGACYRAGVYECSRDGVGGGLDFEGIRQNVPVAELDRGGFEPCWAGLFNGNEPIAGILEACDEGVLLMGCRPVGAEALTIAAMGQRADVLTDTGNGNVTHEHNGVGWYYNGSHSWGFAPAGLPVSRNSCDTNNEQPELRMCWHTNGGNVSSGYRCGATTLNGNAGWERVIYQRPEGPGMVCSEPPGEPVEELCNGEDDDCDGALDEGAEGVGENCQEGVGFCQRGETACDAEGALVCLPIDIEPTPELCNGVDDDCNGEIDDLPGLGEGCEVGLGVCARPGALQCPDGDGVQLQEGVLRDLDPAELERAGFRRCYQGLYNQSTPVAGVMDACQGEVMLIGCRDVGQPNIRVAAMGLRDEVMTDTGVAPNGTHEHNGVAWYYSDQRSIGFARAGQVVNRNSCDTEARDDEDRMCWHTSNGSLNSGWRCGNSTGVGAGHQREIWVADQLGSRLVCAGEPGPPAGDEVCNGLDEDCDGTVDEGFGLGEACAAGQGLCRREGVTVCDAAGEPVCGAEPGEPEVEVCDGLDQDCDGQADEGLDCPFFASCQAAMAAGNVRSGAYPLITPDGPQNFWCDMETDGGGWTLVASTAGTTLDDYGVPYYADLATLAPAQGNPAVFNGFDLGRVTDIRFACRGAREAADAPMTVDLSFYATEWYSEFAAAANDAASCFNEGGSVDVPARRNNLVEGAVLLADDPYNSGVLEGEDGCGSGDDFTVDFDDRGMDSNQSDGTDWGEDDGSRKCGQNGLADGQWFIFVREAQGFIDVDASVTVIGSDALADAFEGGRVPVTRYAYDALPPELELGDVVFWMAPTEPALWPAARALLPAIDAHSRRGGHVVVDRGFAGLLVRRFDAGFTFADALGEPAGWFNGVAAAGGALVAGPVGIDPRGAGAETLFAGLEPPLRHSGTDAFVRVEAEADRPFSLVPLAAFPGDGTPAFPDRSHDAVLRGKRCDGNVLLVGFDFADGLADMAPDAASRFAANLLITAAAAAPADLNDVCPPPGEVRPNILVCGEVAANLESLAPEGSGLAVAPGCAPDADTQAVLVGGGGAFDAATLQAYVAGGGVVITSRGASSAVYNAVFDGDVQDGIARGMCTGRIAPTVQMSPEDTFWRRVGFEAGEQCGVDMAGWPEVVALGGWAERTVSLGYRDLNELGRVWLVEADWSEAPALDARTAGLLGYMVTHAAFSGLHFPGIRQNVPVAELEAGGFEQCYAGDYGLGNVPVANVLGQCDGDVLLIGCRATGSDTLALGAMGERAEVLTDLGREQAAVHTHNGVDWYFSDSYSWGFVAEGTGVQRNSCDTANVQPELRMCWHTSNGNMSSGYRCGAEFPRAGTHEKIIFQRSGPLQ